MVNIDILSIIEKLKLMHGNAQCELDYKTPFELLVAVILSAQCTDKRVNEVTKELFKKYSKPEDFAALDVEYLGTLIKSCGFYRNKANSIIDTSKTVLDRFNGVVPANLDDLTSMRGVGRKTANVVLSTSYKIPAIAVDTHVNRVSKRIGLSMGKDVLNVEHDLMELTPKEHWSNLHQLLVHHGRYICKAIKPQCVRCLLKAECDFYQNEINK